MIKLLNISKSFNSKLILKNISLNIMDSGLHVVSGPSGVGKTTLVRVLIGLEKQDSGKIIGITNKKIAMVFPEDRLLKHLTAFENVNLVSKSPEISNYYLDALDLKESKDKYPDELSTGMKRRVSLARAFCYESDILVLDEPFKSLNDELSESILKVIENISKNKPVIIVTHKVDFFKHKIVSKSLILK